MQLKRSFWMVTLLFSAIIFLACVGCGGGGSSSSDGGGTGTVSFSLTDSTTDQYRAVYITIVGLQICSDRGGPSDNDCNWMSLDPPDGMQFPLTYNLLKLVNGVTEAIGSGEFSAGEYHQVRLIIGDQPELENNLLGEPHPEANYVILNDGNDTIKPLKVPSGPETGLKLVNSFTVGDGEIKELVLDFDACRSVIKAGDSGKYILKPTIKVIEPEDKVDIDGMVTDSSENPIGGASVSAQISDGLSATVVRSTITDDADTENDLEEGEYLLTLLSPDQTYNIVAYSTGKSPQCVAFRYNDPDIDPDLPLDFMLSDPAGFVVVSGEVIVGGGVTEEDFPLVITIYTELDCNHPDGEGYVQLPEVADIAYNTEDDVFEYSIELPIYYSSVTYYVVASAEGYIPDTGTAVASEGDTEVIVAPLVISPGE